MEIKYSNKKPPVYDRCSKQFGVRWEQGIIMTYGDTVHCAVDISEDLKVHEGTHVRQQTQMGKDLWWDMYFNDPEFRLSQEVEAYTNQMNWINENCSRPERRRLRKHIIKSMVRLYGDMCTEEIADKLIPR